MGCIGADWKGAVEVVECIVKASGREPSFGAGRSLKRRRKRRRSSSSLARS
jgi:hypothetical protein